MIRNADNLRLLRGSGELDVALFQHVAVSHQSPMRGVLREIGEEQAVGHLSLASLCIEQTDADRLGRPLHLFHLRLYGTVWPDAAIGAHVAANGIEGASVTIIIEREVEHGLLRASLAISQTLVVDGHIVHLGISRVGGLRILGMVACNASDVDGIGEVAQHATLTGPSIAPAEVIGGFWCSDLLRTFQLTVDVESHLLAVPRGRHMVPVAYPVGRQVDVEGMLDARVQIELQFLISFLNHSELRVAFRDIGCSLVRPAQFARPDVETDGQCLAREFHVTAAIHLHPLVVAVEVQHAFLYLGITHQVDRRVVG